MQRILRAPSAVLALTFVVAWTPGLQIARAAPAPMTPAFTEEERAELQRYAATTWRSLERLTLPSGLPADSIGRSAEGWGKPAGQTSPTNIGGYLWSVLAAEKLSLISQEDSRARLRKTLATLATMERTSGFFLNDLDPRDGRPLRLASTAEAPWSPHVSAVDNGWLAVALTMVANAHPPLRDEAEKTLRAMDFRFFYSEFDPADPVLGPGQLRVGYRPEGREFYGHYGMLNSEARIASYLGIARGQLPREHYYRLYRTFPEQLGPQSQKPQGRVRDYSGVPVFEGTYTYRGARIVPSWGGSMFEALMVTLFVPEDVWAPRSWGVNHPLYVRAHIQHGLEEAGYGVWGFSPAASPRGGYQNYGVKALGTSDEGYHSFEFGAPSLKPGAANGAERLRHGVVTPHASFLALRFAPRESLENLRKLIARFPVYSECGFLDSVDVSAGAVCGTILTVDQAMIMAAIANALADNAMQRAFCEGPIERTIRPLIEVEEFGNWSGTRISQEIPKTWRGPALAEPDPRPQTMNLIELGSQTR
ncbi:MAG: glucoamylase family protein [Isosphaeraceae bacterium]